MNVLPRSNDRQEVAAQAPVPAFPTIYFGPMTRWIAGLHVSACRRWLAVDPLPADEVSRTMATLLDLMDVLETDGGFREDACPFDAGAGLRAIDREACRELLRRIETTLGCLQEAG